MELVLASRNPHKLKELEALLAPHRVVPLPPDVALPPEGGSSFAENAFAKARSCARVLGRAAIGEDSGIEVAALGGGPGVRSARYAGDGASDADNLAKLLRETEGADDRSAAYRCALAYVGPDGAERLFEGRCEGSLARRPAGSGGFGYDPLFVPAEAQEPGRTMAELAPAEKNELSHRGRAARLLLRWLEERG